MQKDYLCKCNMCDTIMFDENPNPIMGQEKKDLDSVSEIHNMIQLKDKEGDIFWGCPKCKTDSYLMDF